MALAPYTVPFEGFAYHEHQVSAITWMILRERATAPLVRGGILADEMGLGKTWMTIGLLLNAPVADTLLLVPPVLQPQWVESLAKAGIPYTVLRPPAKKGEYGSWDVMGGTRAGLHVTLATYDRAANNAPLFEGRRFGRMISDEGHVFRNGCKTVRYARLSAIEADAKWILSGTPIQNRRYDLMHLFRFIGVERDVVVRTTLAAMAEELLLRRTVGDVKAALPIEMPKKPSHVIHPVHMPVDGEEHRVFQALVGRFEHAVEAHAKVFVILELFLRIRQFLAHPSIYVDAMKRKYAKTGTYTRTAWTDTASKHDTFVKLLGTLSKKPTIVFGTFKAELDGAEVALAAAGYKVWSIRGGQTERTRDNAVNESRAAAEAGEPVALVIQIIAGSAGLNLQHCNRIVFLSSHWNPAVVDQAIARAYRLGQTKRVTVHHLLLADEADMNLDRYMASMHGAKRGEALAVHPKLFCEAAIDVDAVLGTLDSSLAAIAEELAGGAAAAAAAVGGEDDE